MKYSTPLIAVSLAAACSAALASEYGTVISSTAVTAQVAVPQQQCTDQQALVQPRTSGGGALLGALVGGVIGDRTEAANTPAAAVPVRSCQNVTSYENRIIGYDVTYEFNGRRYSTRVAQDPGARIALNVTVAPTDGTVAVAPASSLAAPLVTVAPSVVYSSMPAYRYYGPYGYYDGGPVIAVEPRVVIGGYRRHGF